MTVSKLTKKAVKSLLRDKSTTLLGEGAYGTVYSAIFEGRQCVVKIGLSASSIPDFVQESRLMELLGGAGGAPIPLALCRTLPALVMTHCGSTNLFNYLNDSDGDLSLLLTMTLGVRVTECLQQIHMKGIIHCDLKSDNVTLKVDDEGTLGSVHLIDYGYACRVGHKVTDKHKVAGTDWYCDCLFTGEPLSIKCDHPGLGTILDDLFLDRTDVPSHML